MALKFPLRIVQVIPSPPLLPFHSFSLSPMCANQNLVAKFRELITQEKGLMLNVFSNMLIEQVGKVLRKFNKIQMKNWQNLNTTGKFIVWDAYDSTGLGNRYKKIN